MNLFNNIKVDVYGQINNDTVHSYTYPARFNPADTVSSEWLRPIEDPRVVRDKLLTPAPKVYGLHSNPNGVYYSLICPNLRDMRNGYMAVTMFVADGSPKLHGSVVIQALDALKRELVDNANYTNQAVEQALLSAGVPQFTGMPATIEAQPLVSRPNAYRIYSGQTELETLLDNPRQPLYKAYHTIYLVGFEYAPKSTAIELLNQPVVREWAVNKVAQNCTFDEKSVTDGQSVKIIFTREGYKPAQLQFVVGQGATPQGITFADGVMTINEPPGIRWIPTAGTAPSVHAAKKPVTTQRNPLMLYGAIGFVTALLIGLLIWVLVGNGDDKKAESGGNASQTESVAQLTGAEKANYEADVKYMKGPSTWNKSQINSERGRKVIQLMEAGDIDGLLKCEYYKENSTNGQINPHFLKIIDFLHKFTGEKRELAKRYIQKRAAGNTVALSQLAMNLDDVSKGRTPSGDDIDRSNVNTTTHHDAPAPKRQEARQEPTKQTPPQQQQSQTPPKQQKPPKGSNADIRNRD